MAPRSNTPGDGDLQMAFGLYRQGRHPEASTICAHVLSLQPNAIDANYLMGILQATQGALEPASRHFETAARLRPGFTDAEYNCAVALTGLKQYDKALRRLDRVLKQKPGHVEAWTNRGNILRELKRSEEAIECYARALQTVPDGEWLLNNMAVALMDTRSYDAALKTYARVLVINDDNADAHSNMGIALDRLHRREAALVAHRRAAALAPDRASIAYNLGLSLEAAKQLPAAVEAFENALRQEPGHTYLLGACLHAKMQIADWADSEAYRTALEAGVAAGQCVANPFAFLALSDNAPLQRQLATACAAMEYPLAAEPLPLRHGGSKRRIKIGYFSADFRNHPAANLLIGVLQRHDREKFEVFAFSFTDAPDDEMQVRIRQTVDTFVDISSLSDAQAVDTARQFGIDIAVDLMGHTQMARMGIFARRAAPLQVAYLGFPGTSGAAFFDYVIADAVVAPHGLEANFTESILRLPETYFPTSYHDGPDGLANPAISRTSAGLPVSGFVFCCFNNLWKITPDVFALWMQILERVPGSVLWLLEDHAAATKSLRAHAQAASIDPARLIFAGRAPHAHHLARHRLADLFLDTFPYNAHTTCADALWAGLPVLTRYGDAFAARVAASLLSSAGLTEIAVASVEEYVAKAIELATSPTAYLALQRKMANLRDTALFDTLGATRHLERAFSTIFERARAGLPATTLDISAE